MATQIERLKGQLKGGGLSQQAAEGIRQQILGLGGKVNLTNFGYQKSGQAAPTQAGLATPGGVVAATQNINSPGSAIAAEQAAATLAAQQNINFQNPSTFSSPFGSSTTTFDEQGRPVVNQALSGNQQGILEQDENLSSVGRDLATQQLSSGGFSQGFAPELTDRTSSGDLLSDRNRTEDAVFGRLTRDFDDNQQKAIRNKEQELHNKRIPYSDDPNSRYQQEMKTINQGYSDARLDARGQAVQLGGDELQRSFGIGEQLRANEFSEQQGARNQQLGEVGALQGFGSGLLLPSLPGFQGAQYNAASPLESFATIQGLRDVDKDRALQNALAQMSKSSGPQIVLGGQQAPVAGPPLNQGPPPGL